MKGELLFLIGAVGLTGSATAVVACGDDGGAGGSTSSTGQSNPTATSGTQQTTGTMATTTTGTMATTASGMFDCAAPAGNAPAVTLTDIATGLDAPVLVKSAPDNPDRLYIVEQGGQILIWENNAVLPTPFLDVGPIIQAGGEQGLLGLAFHPDYAQNGRFFIHYTEDGSNDSTIFEYRRSVGDPLVADPMGVQLVLQHFTAESNHNGGSIEFGSDGYLYIAFGDGGGANDPECDAQNPGNLLGKIMRLDVNGTPDAEGYPAAPGNPGGTKYFHIGLRNPWRVSFDPCNGDLYIADVGQNQYEEIDVAPPGDAALNFGWPFREGAHDFNNNCPGRPPALTDPIAEYTHGNGRCSVSGGYVHRSATIPDLRGHYIYGDLCTGDIFVLRYENGTVVSPPADLGVNGGNISSFGQDGRGNVYVVDYNGTVSRIDPQ